MAARSVADHVQALLSHRVAEAKTGGASNPDVEAAALLETIAGNLLLYPRSSLVLFFMARNGLMAAIQKELSLIESMKQTVKDLGNQTYAIKNLSALQRAKTALTQMSVQGSVSAEDKTFDRYSQSVDSFLGGTISKNVRKTGATDLARPSAEAGSDLPNDLQDLKDAHDDFLDRLYSMSSGVENFLASPLSTIVGTNLLNRVQEDLNNIIQEIEEDNSGTNSRDVATRLIASRASLRIAGKLPDLAEPIAQVDAVSEPLAASQDITGPFTLPTGSLTIQTAGSTYSATLGALHGLAGVLGDPIGNSITLPAGSGLFLQISGAAIHPTWPTGLDWLTYDVARLPLNSTASPVTWTRAYLANRISFYGAAYGIACSVIGTRLYVFSTNPAVTSITVVVNSVEPHSSATIFVPSIYRNSVHLESGLDEGQSGQAGVTDPELMGVVISSACPNVEVSQFENDLTITSIDEEPGSSITFSGTWASSLGIEGTVYATSNRFLATVTGVGPKDLVDIGGTKYTVASVDETGITLEVALPTFESSVTIHSGLSYAWGQVKIALEAFLKTWLLQDFASSLTRLDRLAATLLGSPTAPRRAEVLSCLTELETWLTNALSIGSYLEPMLSGVAEREVTEGLINTFLERRYDRAADFLLRCKILDVFQMDWQTLSYAGNLMQATENFARSDVFFPDRTRDQGLQVDGRQPDRTGA